MSLARYLRQGQPQQKIRPEHLDRAAVVYVRQSSRQQVLEHSESTRLQYALAERAVALGWARSQVVVIDDDLGVSAATAGSRKGFARLVAEVTMGRVGVVLGIEMSRLARTGRDWHQLLELCCLSGVLLADPDGVYDPGVGNDRLLLGLKGTMSEHELYLIRQRMLSGKLAKAERGELAVPLPIGYVRRPSGEVVLDPDEQARHVVGLVFSTFGRLGTLNGVLRYLAGQQVQLPVRVHSGPAKGEIEWRRPNRETLQIMLHNPVYAGYYAYGRLQVEPRRKMPGLPGTGRVVKDSQRVAGPCRRAACWDITPEQYEANVARMAANRQTAAMPGAPRDGLALLSGRCAAAAAAGTACSAVPRQHGRRAVRARLRVRLLPGQLRDRRALPAHRGSCAGRLYHQPGAGGGGAGRGGGLHGRRRPGRGRAGHAGQAVAAAAGTGPLRRRPCPPPVPARRTGKPPRHPAAGSRLGSRARRSSRLEADYQRFTEEQPKTLSAAERAAIQALATDLPQVWNAPSTSQADRKELLRILIEDITVTTAGNSELVDVVITWAGGHRPPGRPSAPSAAWTSCRTTLPSSAASPSSPPPAARASRSPTPSTPRDSGRPSGPAGSPASRSAP